MPLHRRNNHIKTWGHGFAREAVLVVELIKRAEREAHERAEKLKPLRAGLLDLQRHFALRRT